MTTGLLFSFAFILIFAIGTGVVLLHDGNQIYKEGRKLNRYRESDERFAAQLGVDADELEAATTAIWGNLNPQSMPRLNAQSAAGAVLVALKKLHEDISP